MLDYNFETCFNHQSDLVHVLYDTSDVISDQAMFTDVNFVLEAKQIRHLALWALA